MKILYFMVVFLCIFLVGCVQTKDDLEAPESPILDDSDEQEEGSDNEESPGNDDLIAFNGISERECSDAGGSFNECGSPCAGTDAEVCIMMCRAQCECGGIAGFSCPSGFTCLLSGKVADEIGVCVGE